MNTYESIFSASVIAGCIIFCTNSYAATVTINFDDVPSGTIITDYYSNLGVIFSIDNHPTAQPITVASVSVQINPSSPNALTNNVDPLLSPVQIIRASFVNPIDKVTPSTTDFVSFTYISDQPNFGRMEAYNDQGVLLDSVVSTEPGFRVEEALSVSGNAISHVLIYPDTDIWVDDFTFNAVPIPAAVWLFGSGLVALIGIARKKLL